MPRTTMTAYRLPGWLQPPRLMTVDVPKPGPGEVLVRVAGNGLCHSDLSMSQIPEEFGTALGWRMPFTLGHEVGGWIEEFGDDPTGPAPPGAGLSGARLAIGMPVALVSPTSCGHCRYCLRGLDSACRAGTAGRGYGRDGGLAGYVVADATRAVVPLRTLDPVDAGPLTDAGATSYHAVKRVVRRLTPGSRAVVLGAGGLGAFAIQHLRAMTPALVVAVDRVPARLALAAELGAGETLAGITGNTVKELTEICGGEGADAVIDFVGTDESIATGLGALAPGGAYGLVGAAGGKYRRAWYGGLPREAEIFTFQGSTIADLRDVIALAEAGLVRPLVDRFPLDRVAEAYGALEAGNLRGRAVVLPRG